MGYRIVIFPADAQLASIYAMRALLAHIRANGTAEGFTAMATMNERNSIVGPRTLTEFEIRHSELQDSGRFAAAPDRRDADLGKDGALTGEIRFHRGHQSSFTGRRW